MILRFNLAFLLTLLFYVACDDAHSAEAGWAEVDITPPLGIALGGRGGNYVLAKQVLDPLVAQVTLLKDDKGAQLALVSFDLVGLPHDLSDRLRQSLVQELGVHWNLIILNSSHTHSGPNMLRGILAGVDPAPQIEIDYFKSLQEKLISAARQARKNSKPVAKIEVFEGKSEMAINRRAKNKQGQFGILPNPNGPIDEKLWVLRIQRVNDKDEAVIFAYACHAVIVYGYVGAAISADFPGVARKTIHEKLPNASHVQFVQGFAGNVRPRAVADLTNMNFRSGSPAKLNEAGTRLADDVISAMQRKGEVLKLDFAGASDHPFLARGEPPPRSVYEKMAQESNDYSKRVGEYWLKRYDSGEGFAKGDAWPIGLIRLSKNQWIVYAGGEPVVEWRKKMSAWLAPRKIVTFGYSPEANTYLPTEALLPEGGYEVLESNRARLSSPAPFAVGMEKVIQDSLLRQAAFIENGRK